jgi:hypothetical protein
MSPLLTLLDELIVDIFFYLRPHDIVVCQRSCLQLNAIIHSQLLQYLIRVGRLGLYGPLLPSHTVFQRIEALEKWEATYMKLRADSRRVVKPAFIDRLEESYQF